MLWYKFTFTVWRKRDSYKSLSITYTANSKRQIQVKNFSKQRTDEQIKTAQTIQNIEYHHIICVKPQGTVCFSSLLIKIDKVCVIFA